MATEKLVLKKMHAPHPLPDLLPVKNGEKEAGRNVGDTLSPSLRGEGKGEGHLTGEGEGQLPEGGDQPERARSRQDKSAGKPVCTNQTPFTVTGKQFILEQYKS